MLPQAQQNDLPTPFLVAWPAHIFLITLPASPPAILFQFEHSITSQPVQLFHLVHTFFSLNMSKYVLFCFMFHVLHMLARLSGAIQHILIPWLAHNTLIALPASPAHTLLGSTQTIPTSPVYLYLWVWTCLHVFCSQYFSCLSIPACPHRPSRLTMDHHTKGSAPSSWCTESNPSPHLFTSTQSVPHISFKSMLPSSDFT